MKWPRTLDHKPTVQHQSTSTAADYQASEISKTSATTNAASRKEKDNKSGRKFGLSLFWKNGGKKEKPKKEYASFSGQFPPEEWPVRDEDDLNNLPRDLEHAIIKRINPELTVDNLTRHTVLMKKMEEKKERGMDRVLDKGLDKEDTGVDKGMSTEILTRPRHHHSSKAGKRSAQKASRNKRRVHSSREKNREKEKVKNKAPICVDDYPEREDLIPPRLRGEIPVDEPDQVEEGGVVEEKSFYKKRIENPFQTHAIREVETIIPRTINREHRRREVKDGVVSGRWRKERTSHRSKSWDPHRARLTAEDEEHAGKSPTSEDRYTSVHERDLTVDHQLQSNMNLYRELPVDYSAVYPQNSTLRIDDKIRQQSKGNDKENWEGQGKNGHFLISKHNRSSDHSQTLDHSLSDIPQYFSTNTFLPTHHYEPAMSHSYDPTLPWPKASLHRRHSLKQSSPQRACEPSVTQEQEEIRHVTISNKDHKPMKPKERPEQIDDNPPSTTNTDGLIEDDCRLYQRADEQEDDDACSSLCLNEEVVTNVYSTCVMDCHSPLLASNNHESQTHHYTSNFHQAQMTSIQNSRDNSFKDLVPPAIQRKVSLSPPRAGECSWRLSHHPETTQSESSIRQGSLIQGEQQPEVTLDVHCPELSEVADCSIFDYCQTSEIDSDTDTVRKSVDEAGSESAHWAAEAEKEQEDEFDGSCIPLSHSAVLSMPREARRSETGEAVEIGENQSITGDSGIDSPR